jgi:hypothetical protein
MKNDDTATSRLRAANPVPLTALRHLDEGRPELRKLLVRVTDSDALYTVPLKRRRAVTLAIAAGVAAALLVPMAYALGGADVLSFTHTKPATPRVKHSFGILRINAIAANAARAVAGIGARYPEVVAGKAHGLLGVSTTEGPAYVWVAPATDERQCWFIQLPGDAASTVLSDRRAGCAALPGAKSARLVQAEAVVESADRSFAVCHGLTAPQVHSVQVDLSDRTAVRTNVIGQHFMVAFSGRITPIALTAFDSDGNELGRQEIG